MESYRIIAPQGRGTFAARLDELHDSMLAWLNEEQRQGRRLEYAKVFMSDIQNQHADFCRSKCFTQLLQNCALSVVEQAPLDNSKISILAKTSDTAPDYLFHALRLNDDDTRGMNSYLQTVLLFERYIKLIGEQGLDIATHLIRTWIYVADIDVNYQGVVKARNDIFRQHGLTADTHFVASTGIGGNTAARSASVGIDFLTYPAATAADQQFLHAPDHLNPTHEYGVAFGYGKHRQARKRGARRRCGTADRTPARQHQSPARRRRSRNGRHRLLHRLSARPLRLSAREFAHAPATPLHSTHHRPCQGVPPCMARGNGVRSREKATELNSDEAPPPISV